MGRDGWMSKTRRFPGIARYTPTQTSPSTSPLARSPDHAHPLTLKLALPQICPRRKKKKKNGRSAHTPAPHSTRSAGQPRRVAHRGNADTATRCASHAGLDASRQNRRKRKKKARKNACHSAKATSPQGVRPSQTCGTSSLEHGQASGARATSSERRDDAAVATTKAKKKSKKRQKRQKNQSTKGTLDPRTHLARSSPRGRRHYQAREKKRDGIGV